MSKICLCDLDGIVCDSTKRFERAEAARAEKRRELGTKPPQSSSRIIDEATDLYWQTALSADLIPLDTLIDGAKEALEHIRFGTAGELLFLTSRPESLRAVTLEWLFNHNILFYTTLRGESRPALIMKAGAFQYVKTSVWKAGIIQTLVHFYNASEVLVVEDEEENTKALFNAWTREDVTLRAWSSLKQAMEQ